MLTVIYDTLRGCSVMQIQRRHTDSYSILFVNVCEGVSESASIGVFVPRDVARKAATIYTNTNIPWFPCAHPSAEAGLLPSWHRKHIHPSLDFANRKQQLLGNTSISPCAALLPGETARSRGEGGWENKSPRPVFRSGPRPVVRRLRFFVCKRMKYSDRVLNLSWRWHEARARPFCRRFFRGSKWRWCVRVCAPVV